MPATKRAPRRASQPTRPLNPAEKAFCAFLAHGLPQRQAAKEAGITNPARKLNDPRIQAYRAKLQPEIDAKVLEEQSQRVADLTVVNRSTIIGGLARLAQLPPALTHRSITGQVSAWMGLAKIHRMFVDQEEDLSEKYKDWTDDELEEFIRTGKRPARFDTALEAPGVAGETSQQPESGENQGR